MLLQFDPDALQFLIIPNAGICKGPNMALSMSSVFSIASKQVALVLPHDLLSLHFFKKSLRARRGPKIAICRNQVSRPMPSHIESVFCNESTNWGCIRNLDLLEISRNNPLFIRKHFLDFISTLSSGRIKIELTKHAAPRWPPLISFSLVSSWDTPLGTSHYWSWAQNDNPSYLKDA